MAAMNPLPPLRRILLCLLVTFLASAAAPAYAQDNGIQAYALNNGMKILV